MKVYVQGELRGVWNMLGQARGRRENRLFSSRHGDVLRLRKLEARIMGEVKKLIAGLVEDTSAQVEEGRLEDVAFEWRKIATDISKVGVLANSLSPDAAAGYLLSLERDMAHLPRKLFLPCIRSETGKRRFWGSSHCQQYINRPNVASWLKAGKT